MKKIYLLLVILLWLLLSFAIHVIVLNKLGTWTPLGGSVCTWYTTMPIWAKYSVIIVGMLAGYFVGKHRRRIVYIEKKHWSDLWKK